MLIDERYPELVKNPNEILYLSHTDETTMKKLVKFQKQATEPIAKPLFGFISSIAYVAPPEGRWRKDGSGDKSEETALKVGFKEKRSDWFLKRQEEKPK